MEDPVVLCRVAARQLRQLANFLAGRGEADHFSKEYRKVLQRFLQKLDKIKEIRKGARKRTIGPRGRV